MQPQPSRRFAWPEQHASDAHDRRALLDRDLEVVAHAHRELAEPEVRRRGRASAANHGRGSTAVRRHRHETRDVEPGLAERVDERSPPSPGAHPAFWRLAGEVDLDEHPCAGRVRARAPGRAPAGRPSANTSPRRRARAPCCAGARRGSATRAGDGIDRATTAGAFATSSWARFSPRSVTPAPTRLDDALDRHGLAWRRRARTSADRGPDRAAAAAIRSRTSADAPDDRRRGHRAAVIGRATATSAWRPVTPSRR